MSSIDNPLIEAINQNNFSLAKHLLANGANPDVLDSKGKTPLMLVAKSGKADLAELLLQNGSNIEAKSPDGETPLIFASALGHLSIVKYLLYHNANIKAAKNQGHTSLIFAAQEGHCDIIELLISHGANVNEQNNEGRTPLILASETNQVDTIKLLLKLGASIDKPMKSGVTPLMIAAEHGHLIVSETLLDNRADVNRCDERGSTALLFAAREGCTDVVKFLLEKGANPNVQDKDGATPLMAGAFYGHVETTYALLRGGANPACKHATGKTAWDLAKQESKSRVLEILRPYKEDGWSRAGRIVGHVVQGISNATDALANASVNEKVMSGKEDTSDNLETLLSELNGLTGLNNVKTDVARHISLLRVQQMRREKGLSVPEQSLHMVFSGNPGTGKTSVARLIAKIYKHMGILSKGQFVETDRSGLVAEYVGQTAPKVQSIVKQALGGILFIDEAYTLSGNDRGNDPYGQEAIDTLLKLMEDNRGDLIVIVAGYTEPMAQFVQSNPGLQSRFNKYLDFEDYTTDELTTIFVKLVEQHDYKLTAKAHSKVHAVLNQAYHDRTRAFGNARLARNLFEIATGNHAMRIGSLLDVSESDLVTIEAEDIQQ